MIRTEPDEVPSQKGSPMAEELAPRSANFMRGEPADLVTAATTSMLDRLGPRGKQPPERRRRLQLRLGKER